MYVCIYIYWPTGFAFVFICFLLLPAEELWDGIRWEPFLSAPQILQGLCGAPSLQRRYREGGEQKSRWDVFELIADASDGLYRYSYIIHRCILQHTYIYIFIHEMCNLSGATHLPITFPFFCGRGPGGPGNGKPRARHNVGWFTEMPEWARPSNRKWKLLRGTCSDGAK